MLTHVKPVTVFFLPIFVKNLSELECACVCERSVWWWPCRWIYCVCYEIISERLKRSWQRLQNKEAESAWNRCHSKKSEVIRWFLLFKTSYMSVLTVREFKISNLDCECLDDRIEFWNPGLALSLSPVYSGIAENGRANRTVWTSTGHLRSKLSSLRA